MLQQLRVEAREPWVACLSRGYLFCVCGVVYVWGCQGSCTILVPKSTCYGQPVTNRARRTLKLTFLKNMGLRSCGLRAPLVSSGSKVQGLRFEVQGWSVFLDEAGYTTGWLQLESSRLLLESSRFIGSRGPSQSPTDSLIGGMTSIAYAALACRSGWARVLTAPQ